MPKLAANLTMLYNEAPFLDRFALAAKDGFKAVEFLFPYAFKAEDIRQRLDANGLQLVLHNLPAGNWDGGERGIACHTDRVAGPEICGELPLKRLDLWTEDERARVEHAGHGGAQVRAQRTQRRLWVKQRDCHLSGQATASGDGQVRTPSGASADTSSAAVALPGSTSSTASASSSAPRAVRALARISARLRRASTFDGSMNSAESTASDASALPSADRATARLLHATPSAGEICTEREKR